MKAESQIDEAGESVLAPKYQMLVNLANQLQGKYDPCVPSSLTKVCLEQVTILCNNTWLVYEVMTKNTGWDEG